jgi:alpha-galactosidase
MALLIALLLTSITTALALYHEDGTGRLPAMGWNSWNAYHCDVDADKVMQAANDVVDKGFKDAGYNYIVVDDCWSIKTGRNNITHQIMPNTTSFPEGISGLASKLHGMGLKAGIYSSAGYTTCGGYPASLGYEAIDAETFASWGIDYLKYDK